ncbi:MAG: hypothetical protein AAGA68_15675 [Pseudomonadota bacterium]
MSTLGIRRRTEWTLAMIIITLGLLPVVGTGQEEGADRIERVKRDELGSGQLALLSGRTVGVAIERWMLGGGLSLDRLPIDGDAFLVIHLRGGQLITVIGDERVLRQEGDYWSVPRDVVMAVETDDDSAVLEVTIVR